MASSSRRDGAGGSKVLTSSSPRKGRSAASKAAPADKPAGPKKRTKRETGVIAVKRAGVLPRQARAPRIPAAEIPAAPELETVLEEITQVTALAPASEPAAGALPEEVVADATEEMPLDELVLLTTAEVPAPSAPVITPEEGAPTLAEVVMPPLDVELPPAPVVESEPSAVALPAAPPATARTGLGRLMARLLRWAGASA